MLRQYATVYAFALVAVAFAAVSLIASWLLRPRVYDPIKATTYECGIPAIGSTEIQTNIRFYVYALLFVIFDVEVLYVYPWAVSLRCLGPQPPLSCATAATAGSGPIAIVEMLIFLSILFLGLVYAWRKGALSWE